MKPGKLLISKSPTRIYATIASTTAQELPDKTLFILLEEPSVGYVGYAKVLSPLGVGWVWLACLADENGNTVKAKMFT